MTQKIEGFFDLCRTRGLTGSQGVIIPASNRRHLMLRDDLVEAVAAGQFHIWAAAEVDEAFELLTNVPAGQTNTAGEYPPESLHRAATDRLARYAEELRVMGAEENKPQPVS